MRKKRASGKMPHMSCVPMAISRLWIAMRTQREFRRISISGSDGSLDASFCWRRIVRAERNIATATPNPFGGKHQTTTNSESLNDGDGVMRASGVEAALYDRVEMRTHVRLIEVDRRHITVGGPLPRRVAVTIKCSQCH